MFAALQPRAARADRNGDHRERVATRFSVTAER
jgi:hypothetical protein